MNKSDLIRNLENELEKVKDKSLSRQEIEQIFNDEKILVQHDLDHLMDDEVTCREYYVNKKIALNDIQKSFMDKFKKEGW